MQPKRLLRNLNNKFDKPSDSKVHDNQKEDQGNNDNNTYNSSNDTLIKFLKVNVARRRGAHDLLFHTVNEKNIDILIVAEQNKIKVINSNWPTDNKADVAIAVINQKLKHQDSGKGDGFVWAKIENLIIYGCYVSPNISNSEYNNYLGKLGESMNIQNNSIIVAGDLNAS